MSVRIMLVPELTSIHEQFLALSQIARERFGGALGGRLLLRPRLDAEGIAAVIGASIAGGASLCVDADADRLREGLRAGFVDFVVATPDEALRILKNEIRRARPVAVGLTADPEPCVDAMLSRGLQPDLLSGVPDRQKSSFLGRGAVAVPLQSQAQGTSLLAWSVRENSGKAMRSLADLASASLDPQRDDNVVRRRWLEQSPRYLGRSFATRQCFRMSNPEIAGFLPRARAEFPDAKITRDGEPA